MTNNSVNNKNRSKNKPNNDRLWIAYIIIFSLILTPSIRIKGIPAFRVEQIVIIIIAIYTLIKTILGRKIKINNPLFVLLYGGLSFFILLSILVGSCKGIRVILNDFFEIYKIFVYLSIFLYISSIIKTDADRLKVIKFTNLCLLGSVFIAIQQYFNLFNLNEIYVPIIAPTQYKTLVNNYPYPRVVGMTSNPNEYSVMPGIGGVLSWSMFINTKRKKHILNLLIFSLGVLMTLSRTGLVFFIVCILTYSILHLYENLNKGRVIKFFTILFLTITLLLVAILLFKYLPEGLTWRFKAGLDIKLDKSFQARLSNWTEHINYFKMSPMFGLGPAKSIAYQHSVDNEWLLFLRQYGIIGCLYVFLTFSFPFIIKTNSYYKYLYLSIIVGSAIYMIPAIIYNSFQLMPLVMVFAGLIPNDRNKMCKQ